MKLALSAVLIVSAFGCGTSNGPDYIAGFDPAPAASGYTRFVTPTVTGLAPGANVEYCQWVADPRDAAYDVLDFTGEQSATGHHAVLYATTDTSFKVGDSHICTTDDMLQISFVGAIGGESNGGNASKLPDGLFFRVPAGTALMANTHWLNATDKTVEGQAVLDVEFTPASDTRTTADIFANNGDNFSIPANAPLTYDVTCAIPQDLNLAMVTNHMHGDGTSAYSEIIHPDGTKDMLVADMPWSAEEMFNPNYMRYSVAAPMVAHAGDTYHTHCEWLNQTASAIMFPNEMCAGVGFYFPSNGQLTCNDGGWLK
jgi:hypothetical protein